VTIQDLGSIGELIAAVATVATLAYLVWWGHAKGNYVTVVIDSLSRAIETATPYNVKLPFLRPRPSTTNTSKQVGLS